MNRSRRALFVLGPLALTPMILSSGVAAAGPVALSPQLPLGDSDLPETRSVSTLAPGVTLTRIHRGDAPAAAGEILTTQRGPWNVDLVTIDPRHARGRLAATYGPDIARTETVSELAARTGAVAAVNASFFTFTSSTTAPGDPVGAGVYAGRLDSEPSLDPAQRAFVVDSKTGKTQVARWSWSAALQSKRTGQLIALDAVEHTPAVPAACADQADQTTCPVDGDTVRISRDFAASTPSGVGVEVVLDRRQCVVGTHTTRGLSLLPGQTSVQATGRDAARLLQVADRGCLRTESALTDQDGRRVHLTRSSYAVNGHPQLTEHGAVVAPTIDDSFNNRNPRTFAGHTSDGRIVLGVIDGRQTTSVGTTIVETAAVATSLGLVDSLNLDGGGSSTMVARNTVINTPSNTGATQRPVGDALIYLPR